MGRSFSFPAKSDVRCISHHIPSQDLLVNPQLLLIFPSPSLLHSLLFFQQPQLSLLAPLIFSTNYKKSRPTSLAASENLTSAHFPHRLLTFNITSSLPRILKKEKQPSERFPNFCNPTNNIFSSQAGKHSTSALMSVDIRQSLTCLRYPSRFETVSRTQLSKEHSGDLTRPIDRH